VKTLTQHHKCLEDLHYVVDIMLHYVVLSSCCCIIFYYTLTCRGCRAYV